MVSFRVNPNGSSFCGLIVKVFDLEFCYPGEGCYVSEDNESWNPADGSDVFKGHTPRKFIYECNITCLCHGACRNRLVQKGSQLNLAVFWTGQRGWGLKTLDNIVKGQFVLEYHGEVCTNAETMRRATVRPSYSWFSLSLDADFRAEAASSDDTALSKDALMFGNVGRFLNHRCEDANLVDVPVKVDKSDPRLYHVAFFAVRDIAEHEELTWVSSQVQTLHHFHFLILVLHCQCHSNKTTVVWLSGLWDGLSR